MTETPGKDITMAVVGVGMMGKYGCLVNQDPSSRIFAKLICDPNLETLASVSKAYGVPETTTSFDEVISRDDIDIVGIYTPDSMHADQCVAALEAGKHVVVTKPIVDTVEGAEKVIDAVRRTGRKLLVGQTCRFANRFLLARQLFDDGELGDLIFAEAHYIHDYRPFVTDKFPWRKDSQLDLLVGGGCHPIDLLIWFMGLPDEVHAYANNGGMVEGWEIPNNFLINIKFKSGRIARCMAAFGVVHAPYSQIILGLYGNKGTFWDDKYILDKYQGLPYIQADFKGPGGHQTELLRYFKHFEDCLLNGTKPNIDAVDGARIIATCEAVWESVRTGQPVKVRTEF